MKSSSLLLFFALAAAAGAARDRFPRVHWYERGVEQGNPGAAAVFASATPKPCSIPISGAGPQRAARA